MIVSMCAGWGQAKDGIADYSGHLAEELARAGFDVRRTALGNYIGDTAYYKKAALEASGADVCHVQFNYPYFNGELPYRNRFAGFVKEVKPPVVMTAHEVRVGFGPGMSGFSSGMMKAVFEGTIPIWNALSAAMHKKMYAAPEKIIVHTDEHARTIRKLAADPDKVVLIPHGVPVVSAAVTETSKPQAKKKLGVEARRVVTIFGFINPRKGHAAALDALAGLPKDVVLLIAGGKMSEDGACAEYYETLKKKISENNLEGRVIITGYVGEKDIPDIMAASDLCLAPFESTAASGALGLCIGYHKPVIASDAPVHREINQRVACLELFKSADSADLGRKIAGLFANRHRMAELSEKARVYAGEYGYPNIAKRTAEIYRDALARGRAGGRL